MGCDQPPWSWRPRTSSSMCSISSSAAPGPQNSRATRRLTSSAHQRSGSADGRQRLDEGRVGEHRVVFDGLRQLEDLEQVERARGEDRQAVRALGVQAARADSASRRSRSERSDACAAWLSPSSSRTRRAARSSSERTSVRRAAGVANSRGSRLTKSDSTLASPARIPARRRRRSGVMSLACMRRSYPCGRAGAGFTRRPHARGRSAVIGGNAAVRRAMHYRSSLDDPPPCGVRASPRRGKEDPHAFSGLLATIHRPCAIAPAGRTTMCAWSSLTRVPCWPRPSAGFSTTSA